MEARGNSGGGSGHRLHVGLPGFALRCHEVREDLDGRIATMYQTVSDDVKFTFAISPSIHAAVPSSTVLPLAPSSHEMLCGPLIAYANPATSRCGYVEPALWRTSTKLMNGMPPRL